MAKHIEVGDKVYWRWAGGVAEGVVQEIVPGRKSILSASSRIVRNGTPDNPAVVMSHESGNDVLKLESELLSEPPAN